MIDVGWVVAAALALVCVWLMWVVEKAYSTGISVGRTQVLEEEIARIRKPGWRVGRTEPIPADFGTQWTSKGGPLPADLKKRLGSDLKENPNA